MNRVKAVIFTALLGACGPAQLDDESIETNTLEHALSSDPTQGTVIAYESDDGRTIYNCDHPCRSLRSQRFGPGVYLASAGDLARIGNDETRSIRLAPAMSVKVCIHEGSESGCRRFENLTGSEKLFKVQTGGISRIEVRPMMVGYRQPNFGGVAQGFEIGRYDSLAKIQFVGNDAIRSIRQAPGVSARVCSDNPETTVGAVCETVYGNRATLAPNLENNISWVDVEPLGSAFEGSYFEGRQRAFNAGVLPLSAFGDLPNDSMSSISVPEGTVTRVCSDNPYTTVGGTCVVFSKSSMAFSSDINDSASWLESSTVVIRSPLNEEYGGEGQVTTLRGSATAVTGEQIPNERLSWTSSVDGFLGTGRTLPVVLSAPSGCFVSREHIITLTATDASGRKYTTRRFFFVASPIC